MRNEEQKKYHREWMSKWRKENPERVKEILAKNNEYFKNHPGYQIKHRIKLKKIYEKYGLGLGTIRRYGFKLALQVYENFGRKCIECGEINNLTIHHLDRNGSNNLKKGLPMNNELNNLILICRKCHGKIHGGEHGKNYQKRKGEK